MFGLGIVMKLRIFICVCFSICFSSVSANDMADAYGDNVRFKNLKKRAIKKVVKPQQTLSNAKSNPTLAPHKDDSAKNTVAKRVNRPTHKTKAPLINSPTVETTKPKNKTVVAVPKTNVSKSVPVVKHSKPKASEVIANRQKPQKKSKSEVNKTNFKTPKPPALVASVQEKRKLSDFTKRKSMSFYVRRFFLENNYELLESNLGLHYPVFENEAPTDLDSVIKTIGVPRAHVVSDKATNTVVVLNKDKLNLINIGEAFVSSFYAEPLQARIPIEHPSSMELEGSVVSDSRLLEGAMTKLIKTSYGTLIEIYGQYPVNTGINIFVEYKDLNSTAHSQKTLYATPNTIRGRL